MCQVFLKDWNGVSVLYSSNVERPDISLWSDASGSWGCGAVWNKWFQVSWQKLPEFEKAPIAPKELLPLCWQLHCGGRNGAASLCNAIMIMR